MIRATLLLAFSVILAGAAHGQTPTTTVQNVEGDIRLQLNHDGAFYIPGTFVNDGTENDSIPSTGSGTRMMWYPAKAAFRAGRVGVTSAGFDWDASNVGPYSVAFGLDTEAGGHGAVAMGAQTTAGASHSFAMGNGTVASGTFGSAALGNFTTASGALGSFAVGDQTIASGEAATAMGSSSEATGDAAMSIGHRTIASGKYSIAMGSGATARSEQSVAIGYQTKATDASAIALGYQTEATGLSSMTMGFGTNASGTSSAAMGSVTKAATGNSLSVGLYNSANTIVDNTAFVVGNGSSGARSDALVLDFSGNLEISGTLTESSDRRLKTSIRPMESETLNKLSRLRPVRYVFKNQQTHPSGEQIGLVAQDVRKEFPALVGGEDGEALSLSYSKFTAVLLKGIQEQQAEIDENDSRIANLQAENDVLRMRLDRLEQAHEKQPVVAGIMGPWGVAMLLACAIGGVGGLLLSRRTGHVPEARS